MEYGWCTIVKNRKESGEHNLKNTLLDVAQNFDKMSDSEKVEVNDNIRKIWEIVRIIFIIQDNVNETLGENIVQEAIEELKEEWKDKLKEYMSQKLEAMMK